MQGTLEKEIILDKDKYTVGQLTELLGFPSRQSVYYLTDHLSITLVRESTRKSYMTREDAQRIVNHVQGRRAGNAERKINRSYGLAYTEI